MSPLSFCRLLSLVLCVVSASAFAQPTQYATIGQVVRTDPQLNRLILVDAKIEIIASGFGHLEGPVWVKDSNLLLVNDTKAQITYKWSPTEGLSKFVEHTGYTGRLPYGEKPGSNGMTVDGRGRIIVCDHGDRRIAAMPLRGKGGKQTLTDNVAGKRYNSPNDVVAHPNGSLYFTDPPYGLPLKADDPTRESTSNGVYRLTATGTATLLTDDVLLPNGLTFSPDYKTLYVAQSDSTKPLIMAFPILADGSLGKGRVYFNGASLPKLRPKEVFDGLKADQGGNLWATGRGGVLVIAPTGKLLGRIDTGEVVANCAWGDDGRTLYIASEMFLCRIKTNAAGIVPGPK
ncbi:SMP-30/gluconolactonase/LRE family protein [Spirosoma arcticum]